MIDLTSLALTQSHFVIQTPPPHPLPNNRPTQVKPVFYEVEKYHPFPQKVPCGIWWDCTLYADPRLSMHCLRHPGMSGWQLWLSGMTSKFLIPAYHTIPHTRRNERRRKEGDVPCWTSGVGEGKRHGRRGRGVHPFLSFRFEIWVQEWWFSISGLFPVSPFVNCLLSVCKCTLFESITL